MKHLLNVRDKFSNLEILEIESRQKIKCQCLCGNIKYYNSYQLVNKKVISCGCIKNKKHGLKNTRIYNIWSHMKKRCYNPKMQNYKWYGGKGIKVCNEWKNNFKAFYDWALNNNYQKNLSIERKDSTKDYCPENCCWIELKEQNKNKTNSLKLTIFGETKNASDWTRDKRCKVKSNQFYWRIYEGMNPELALITPPEKRENNFRPTFRSKYLK